LGRIFKTEHILKVLSDKLTRSSITTGLLKTEQLHQLAIDLNMLKEEESQLEIGWSSETPVAA